MVNLPTLLERIFSHNNSLQPIPGGYNSDVIFVSDQKLVVKMIGGKKDLSLTPQEAFALGESVGKYRTLLGEKGVPIPDFLEWAVTTDNDKAQTYLVLVEPYGGCSAAESLTEGNLDVVDGLLRAIHPLLSDPSLTVGIDSKTSNFVGRDTSNRLKYVDFMPPRFVTETGECLVEYPNLTRPEQLAIWKWKYFTPQGIMVLALSQMGRVAPGLFKQVKANTCVWLRERGENTLFDYLKDLLEGLNPKVIESADNLYVLRLFASELASRRTGLDSSIEEFFIATHYEGDPTPEMMDWAKTRLLEAI